MMEEDGIRKRCPNKTWLINVKKRYENSRTCARE